MSLLLIFGMLLHIRKAQHKGSHQEKNLETFSFKIFMNSSWAQREKGCLDKSCPVPFFPLQVKNPEIFRGAII